MVIHTFEGFGVVNKTEIDVFLELFCFFDDPADIGNLIYGSSAFSKTSLNICKFSVHILLKPGLEKFEHYFTSMWDEYNCAVVWAFFGIAFLRDRNENWPFPVVAIRVNKRVRNVVLGCNLKNDRMISVCLQGKPFNIMVIQAYAPTSNTEEAEVEWFYENIQDILELIPKKDVLFIIGDWNAQVGSQEHLE